MTRPPSRRRHKTKCRLHNRRHFLFQPCQCPQSIQEGDV
jgi:hypothetical protein